MPFARALDRLTSHEAAESVIHLSETKKAIYTLLEFSRTDEELILAYYQLVKKKLAPKASDSGIRSRRAELVREGLVKETGFDKTIAGRRTTVWGRS
jgi:hypothetical protein